MREERSIREASESVISSNPRVLAAISGSFRASGSGAGLYLSISLTDPPASLVLALLGRTSFSFFSDWRPLLQGGASSLRRKKRKFCPGEQVQDLLVDRSKKLKGTTPPQSPRHEMIQRLPPRPSDWKRSPTLMPP